MQTKGITLNCLKFANVINHATITNICNSDNGNIAYIKTQSRHIMAAIAYRILKFKSRITKPNVKNHAFPLLLLLLVGPIPLLISILL